MTKKYRNIKVSGRSIKAPFDCYTRIKENSKKQNLSMAAYLERLVLEDEVNLVQKAITRHFGSMDHLLTQYVDPSFSDIISLLKVIFLRSIQLDIEERRRFLNEFGNILEKQVKSMQIIQNKNGGDEE